MVSPLWSVALTFLSLAVMWLVGRKLWQGWLLGIAVQGVWAAYALATSQVAFLLSSTLYAVLYIRNLRAWRADAMAQ